jgi:hypothetical protein
MTGAKLAVVPPSSLPSLFPACAIASEVLEIYELSESISEVSENSARFDHTLYLLCHGRLLFLRSATKNIFRALVEVQRFGSAMENPAPVLNLRGNEK